jgi:MFS family permease
MSLGPNFADRRTLDGPMRIALALRPLRHRGYATVWTAGLVSNIGTWLQTVAVGALVTALTHNPIWTAVAYIAGFLPMGIISPIGGALADRFDRKKVTIGGTLLEASLAILLAVLVASGWTHPALVNLIVFAAGCVAAFRMPFQQAMLPDLVPREDIVGALSLGSAQWNFGRVVGPALAGVVIVAGSFSLAFALNAVSFVAVVIAYAVVKVPKLEVHEDWQGIVAQLRAGAGVVRRDPGMRAALLFVAVASAVAAPFMSLIAAMGEELADDGGAKAIAAATGALTTGQGIGAVLGALVLPGLVDRWGRGRTLTAAMVGCGVVLIPYGLSPNVPAAAVALTAVGGVYILVLSGLSAVIQLRADPEFRGRAISLFWSVLSIGFPVGALAQGALARATDMRVTTLTAGVVMMAVVLALRISRPHLFSALDDDEAEAAEDVDEPEGFVAEGQPLGA